MLGARVHNSKMALGHRVKRNISPLLSTFYCKCTINKSRFKNSHSSKEGLQSNNAVKSSTLYTSFNQMMVSRQEQAQRSILLRINSINSLTEIEKSFSRIDKILHILPYSTVNDKIFVLVEFHSGKGVQVVRNTISHVPLKEVVHTHSPVFFFKDFNREYTNKKERESNGNKIYPYSRFKPCSANHIWEELHSIKTVPAQMVSLSNMLSITDMDVRLRFYTAAQISYYMSKLFANVSVIPFGSSVNGFGQLGCDLDLLCKVNCEKNGNDWKKMFSLGQHFSLDDRNIQIEFLELISVIMRKCIPGIYNAKKIMEARVPIIKFFNSYTNMQCDLSSTNAVALNMSELLFTYGALDSRIKPLVCTIRKWARSACITRDNPGPWITNFSLTLLIIFYLQTRNILPSLNVIKHFAGNHDANAVIPAAQWFTKWRHCMQLKNTENLYNLLYGFFEYYSIFDFNMHGICVRDAKLKPKKDNSPLYIYNPFETTLNVSKNVHQIELGRIIDKFRNALQTLIDVDENYAILKLINVIPIDGVRPQQKEKTSNPKTHKIADQILNNSSKKEISGGNDKLMNESLLATSVVIKGAESIIK